MIFFFDEVGNSFNPGQLSGQLLWLDGSDLSTITKDGSNLVSQWNDKSGNSNNATQATGTKQPTYTTSVLNGKSGIVFDGTSDSMTCPNAVRDAVAIGTAHTIFCVYQATNITGSITNGHSLYSSSTGSSDRSGLQITENSGSPDITASYFNGTTFSNRSGTATLSATMATVTHAASSQPSLFLNGATQIGTTNGSLNNSGIFRIGADNTNGTDRFFAGSIVEFIIYNRVLSSAEIVQVERYLANKYALYYPGINWINSYSAWQQVLINAWGINKDDAFTNTTNNPFAAIYDPSAAALGSTTSLADTGRGVNTATEATNPPVNTANAIGSARGLLYNGTTTTLNAGSNSSIDNIFAAGGCYIAVINPTTQGEGTLGRIFDKGGVVFSYVQGSVGGKTKLNFSNTFDITPGLWQSTNFDITFGAANIVAVTYNSSSASNDPVFYTNSITAVAVTETGTPLTTANSDAASDLILGNRVANDRTFDGSLGKFLLMKSIPTTAQRTAVFNFLATEYGVTLT